jgi:hypothetical protein
LGGECESDERDKSGEWLRTHVPGHHVLLYLDRRLDARGTSSGDPSENLRVITIPAVPSTGIAW